MPANDVWGMLREAARAMGIGIAGVFAVLTVFYGALKLLMAQGKDSDSFN
ncbi:MAG: hypothetical protein FWF69_06440 [Firmicutes bacterium]|nr:hypothetical protein [Bacillota bacterium]